MELIVNLDLNNFLGSVIVSSMYDKRTPAQCVFSCLTITDEKESPLTSTIETENVKGDGDKETKQGEIQRTQRIDWYKKKSSCKFH